MVNEGVRRAYLHPDNMLRASILADPAGARKNTRDNTPAVIHMEARAGRHASRSTVAAKGGGSENKSKFVMLNPVRQHRRLGHEDGARPWARAGVRRACSASASAAPPKRPW